MPRCVRALCKSFLLDVKFKKTHYERCKTLLKRFQKMHTAEFYLPMKKFSILRRNSIAKMTTYMPKVVMKPKTKSQGFIAPFSIGNNLARSFALRCNPDSFLQSRCKKKWWGLLGHIKWCLTIHCRILTVPKLTYSYGVLFDRFSICKRNQVVHAAHPPTGCRCSSDISHKRETFYVSCEASKDVPLEIVAGLWERRRRIHQH